MPVKKTSRKISNSRKKSNSRKRDHKCVWIGSDHEYRNSARCRICGRGKTYRKGYCKYF